MPDALIYLVAPAGVPNFGDEYIVSSWLRTLAVVRPDAQVVLDCHSPGIAAVLHRGEHPNLVVTDTLWRIAAHAEAAAEGEQPGQIVAHAQAIAADPGVHPELVSGVILADQATVIHMLGGGWLNDLWPRHLGVLAAAAALGAPQVQRVATGQGLIPLETLREPVVEILTTFDVVDLRDAPSHDLLDALPNAGWSGDDAWLGIANPDFCDGVFGAGAEDARARKAVLCLQSDLLSTDPPAVARWVMDALEHYGFQGRDLCIVECIPGVDAKVRNALSDAFPEAMEGARFVPFHELWDLGLPADAHQVWLSTRYHPHMIAAARGAQGCALEVHEGEYYEVKHQAVQAAGSLWPLVQWQHQGATHWPQPGAGMSPDATARAWERKVSVVRALYPQQDAPSLLQRLLPNSSL